MTKITTITASIVPEARLKRCRIVQYQVILHAGTYDVWTIKKSDAMFVLAPTNDSFDSNDPEEFGIYKSTNIQYLM
jgi:hypothetical protein